MLHVFWVILKTAGIILLILLAFLLLAVCCALLVPVRYKARFSKYGTDSQADIRASWLAHIVSFRYWYRNGENGMSLKIFGIPAEKLKAVLARMAEWKGLLRKKRRKNSEGKAAKIKAPAAWQEDKAAKKPEIPVKDTKEAEALAADEPEEKKRRINKVRAFIHKIKRWFIKIKRIIRKQWLTWKAFCGRIGGIREFLGDEAFKAALPFGFQQFMVLFRHIRPGKYRIYFTFGTGDPASTGLILGVFGMLCPVYQEHIRIVPDFEQVVFEGEADVKGRIRALRLLLTGWKVYRDENIKQLYSRFMEN